MDFPAWLKGARGKTENKHNANRDFYLSHALPGNWHFIRMLIKIVQTHLHLAQGIGKNFIWKKSRKAPSAWEHTDYPFLNAQLWFVSTFLTIIIYWKWNSILGVWRWKNMCDFSVIYSVYGWQKIRAKKREDLHSNVISTARICEHVKCEWFMQGRAIYLSFVH